MSMVDSKNKSDFHADSESPGAIEHVYVGSLGKEFRIVEKGLDPEEVMEFLQETTGSSDDVFQRLEQFSALQAAARTMEESIAQARRLAEYAKKQAETEARQKKAQAAEEAERQATVIIDQTGKSCTSFVDSTRVALLEAIKEALGQARDMVSHNLTQIREEVEEAAKSHLAQWEIEAGKPTEQPVRSAVELNDSRSDGDVAEEEGPEKAVPDLLNLYGGSTGLHRGEHLSDDVQAVEYGSGKRTEFNKDTEGEEASNTATVGRMDDKWVEAADGLYRGSVRVIIPRGVKETWMQQFRDRISHMPGVRIQGESERDKERIEVTLSLEKPIEILPLLQELPNVRKVMEAWNSGGSPEKRGSGQVQQVSEDSGEVALILQFA
jgi:vacuolar-type H+-ATPase subunit E/Vma4